MPAHESDFTSKMLAEELIAQIKKISSEGIAISTELSDLIKATPPDYFKILAACFFKPNNQQKTYFMDYLPKADVKHCHLGFLLHLNDLYTLKVVGLPEQTPETFNQEFVDHWSDLCYQRLLLEKKWTHLTVAQHQYLASLLPEAEMTTEVREWIMTPSAYQRSYLCPPNEKYLGDPYTLISLCFKKEDRQFLHNMMTLREGAVYEGVFDVKFLEKTNFQRQQIIDNAINLYASCYDPALKSVIIEYTQCLVEMDIAHCSGQIFDDTHFRAAQDKMQQHYRSFEESAREQLILELLALTLILLGVASLFLLAALAITTAVAAICFAPVTTPLLILMIGGAVLLSMNSAAGFTLGFNDLREAVKKHSENPDRMNILMGNSQSFFQAATVKKQEEPTEETLKLLS